MENEAIHTCNLFNFKCHFQFYKYLLRCATQKSRIQFQSLCLTGLGQCNVYENYFIYYSCISLYYNVSCLSNWTRFYPNNKRLTYNDMTTYAEIRILLFHIDTFAILIIFTYVQYIKFCIIICIYHFQCSFL